MACPGQWLGLASGGGLDAYKETGACVRARVCVCVCARARREHFSWHVLKGQDMSSGKEDVLSPIAVGPLEAWCCLWVGSQAEQQRGSEALGLLLFSGAERWVWAVSRLWRCGGTVGTVGSRR